MVAEVFSCDAFDDVWCGGFMISDVVLGSWFVAKNDLLVIAWSVYDSYDFWWLFWWLFMLIDDRLMCFCDCQCFVMICWWLSDECLMMVWFCLMIVWWFSDVVKTIFLMIVWRLFDSLIVEFDDFLMCLSIFDD